MNVLIMVLRRNFVLPGVKIKTINKIPDERGFFSEIFREDWNDFVDNDKAVQANFSHSYPGVIRAWHRHHKGQVDYFLCLRGSIKICLYDDKPDSPTNGQLDQIISSGEKLQIVRIPGHFWHGFKSVGYEPALLVYFTTNLYDYKNPDEERRPWNDPTILDPKTGNSFDWNKLPHQ